ncbi:MAG: hypothetical protein IPK85_04440 [Gemmatimonadetes bacterium]|nr:hypothetical protein [Gemmatimonadota bacterium]
MRTRLLRLSLALMGLGVTSLPAATAFSGCPSNIVIGLTACHLVSGDNCSLCEYNCDGSHVWFNMC